MDNLEKKRKCPKVKCPNSFYEENIEKEGLEHNAANFKV